MIQLKLEDGKEYLFILNNKVFKQIASEGYLDVISEDFTQDDKLTKLMDCVPYVGYLGFKQGEVFSGDKYPYSKDQTEALIPVTTGYKIAEKLMQEIVSAAEFATRNLNTGKK